MREHPTEREIYGELKEKLATHFPYDVESYINGKNHLVKEIEQNALNWYRENQK